MCKILVTGSSGFFASRFIDTFKSDYPVIGFTHAELDITDEDAISRKFETVHPDYVVHAAALSDTGFCQNNEELSYAINVKGTTNIIKACRDCHSKLIYLSSDQVYNGNPGPGPYTEDGAAVPNTVYGKHKQAAESAVRELLPQSVILRLTWMFSLPERNKNCKYNIVWSVLRALIKNEEVSYSSHEYRGMTYLYDLLRNFEKIMRLPGGVYNTGSENEKSTADITSEILELLGCGGRKNELLIWDDIRFQSKHRDLRISNQKLKEHGIVFNNTTDGIKSCLSDFSLLNV